MTETISPAEQQLQTIVDAAQQMGVELDREEALQWLTAIAAAKTQDQVQFDERTGVFGHRIVMLDFSEEQLAYFREVGRLVEFQDEPGVETALALSGSAAQSKVQSYPGDCDYFERVNIHAATRAEACTALARLMRDKALATRRVPGAQLIEVKFGSYPLDVIVDGRRCKAGAPIAWSPDQIERGKIEGVRMNSARAVIRWEDAAAEPGWCKLDWVVLDPVRRRLANASNMLDVTWEAPDGNILPLDGYLDPYFQEVYLEADSIPIFTKLSRHVSADALDDYVEALEREVRKYVTKDLNYGKAAKRMYNIFRLTGRYPEAAFIRELFDEPASLLYQVWSLIRTLDDTSRSGTESIPLEQVEAQTDQLIMTVVQTLEGEEEDELVRRLLTVRDLLGRRQSGEMLTWEAEAARQQLANIVNNFFHDRLVALPQIRDYMDRFRT
jgi:hypothetical protein